MNLILDPGRKIFEMTKTVDFIFDFASPNAYLAHKVLPAFAARTGAVIRYIPCLLGGIFKATNNKAPMVQFAEIPAKLAYDKLEIRRFIAAHGIAKFRMNPHFPVNSLLIMRGAIVAEADGVLDRYIDAVFTDMWEAGRNMADPEVVAAALTEDGFDGPAVLARTQDQSMKDKLAANTERAVARGAFGIPTFFVGEEMFFGKERLWQVAEAIK
jgi:2-hydroxychromene-2-carboxylate isomerase